MTRAHFPVDSNHNLQLPDFCEPFHARVVAKTLTYHAAFGEDVTLITFEDAWGHTFRLTLDEAHDAWQRAEAYARVNDEEHHPWDDEWFRDSQESAR